MKIIEYRNEVLGPQGQSLRTQKQKTKEDAVQYMNQLCSIQNGNCIIVQRRILFGKWKNVISVTKIPPHYL